MEEREYQDILEKFLKDKPLNAEEAQKLLTYLREHQQQPQLQEEIEKALRENTFGKLADTTQAERIFQNIIARANQSEKDEENNVFSSNFLRIAASIIFIIGLSFGGYHLYNAFSKKEIIAAKAIRARTKQEVPQPGSDKAFLKLANGDSILLDSSGSRTLAMQGGTEVFQQGGKLSYRSNETNKTAEPIYNVLSIPRGGKFQLVLPDGSKVWLNSVSSLRFPTAFTGKERRVELTGEAYFEVAKNEAVPFVVESNGQEVKVLGTHFNISAYHDEEVIKTTLLEGAVQIIKQDKNVLLTPGSQSVLQKSSGAIQVAKVNTEVAVAWKNELFVFKNSDIKSVMRQLSRWYDVDVVFKDDVDTHLNGMISRNTSLSDILKILALSGEAHFKINGKVITVSDIAGTNKDNN